MINRQIDATTGPRLGQTPNKLAWVIQSLYQLRYLAAPFDPIVPSRHRSEDRSLADQDGRRGRLTPELRLLAVGTALGLAGIDVVYVARRRISPIYLLDALLNLAQSAGWLAGRLTTGTASERELAR